MSAPNAGFATAPRQPPGGSPIQGGPPPPAQGQHRPTSWQSPSLATALPGALPADKPSQRTAIQPQLPQAAMPAAQQQSAAAPPTAVPAFAAQPFGPGTQPQDGQLPQPSPASPVVGLSAASLGLGQLPGAQPQTWLGNGHQAILRQLKASSDLHRLVQFQMNYLMSSLLQSGLSIDHIALLMGQSMPLGQQASMGMPQFTDTLALQQALLQQQALGALGQLSGQLQTTTQPQPQSPGQTPGQTPGPMPGPVTPQGATQTFTQASNQSPSLTPSQSQQLANLQLQSLQAQGLAVSSLQQGLQPLGMSLGLQYPGIQPQPLQPSSPRAGPRESSDRSTDRPVDAVKKSPTDRRNSASTSLPPDYSQSIRRQNYDRGAAADQATSHSSAPTGPTFTSLPASLSSLANGAPLPQGLQSTPASAQLLSRPVGQSASPLTAGKPAKDPQLEALTSARLSRYAQEVRSSAASAKARAAFVRQAQQARTEPVPPAEEEKEKEREKEKEKEKEKQEKEEEEEDEGAAADDSQSSANGTVPPFQEDSPPLQRRTRGRPPGKSSKRRPGRPPGRPPGSQTRRGAASPSQKESKPEVSPSLRQAIEQPISFEAERRRALQRHLESDSPRSREQWQRLQASAQAGSGSSSPVADEPVRVHTRHTVQYKVSADRFKHVIPESLRQSQGKLYYHNSATANAVRQDAHDLTERPPSSPSSSRSDGQSVPHTPDSGERSNSASKAQANGAPPRTRSQFGNLDSNDDGLGVARGMSITIADPAEPNEGNGMNAPRSLGLHRSSGFARFITVNPETLKDPSLRKRSIAARRLKQMRLDEDEEEGSDNEGSENDSGEASDPPRVGKRRGRKPGKLISNVVLSDEESEPSAEKAMLDAKTKRELRALERRSRDQKNRALNLNSNDEKSEKGGRNSAEVPAAAKIQPVVLPIMAENKPVVPPPVQPQSRAQPQFFVSPQFARSFPLPNSFPIPPHFPVEPQTPNSVDVPMAGSIPGSLKRDYSDQLNASLADEPRMVRRRRGASPIQQPPQKKTKYPSGAPPPVMPLRRPQRDDREDSEENDSEESSEEEESEEERRPPRRGRRPKNGSRRDSEEDDWRSDASFKVKKQPRKPPAKRGRPRVRSESASSISQASDSDSEDTSASDAGEVSDNLISPPMPHYVTLRNKSMKCSLCGRVFNDQEVMERHLLNHKATLLNNRCSQCGQSFRRKDQLRKHRVMVHGHK